MRVATWKVDQEYVFGIEQNYARRSPHVGLYDLGNLNALIRGYAKLEAALALSKNDQI